MQNEPPEIKRLPIPDFIVDEEYDDVDEILATLAPQRHWRDTPEKRDAK